MTTVTTPIRATISKGNRKIGTMPNFSLPPLKSCSEEACRTCGKACYARKSYRIYPQVKRAWDGNMELALRDIPKLEKDISASLSKSKPKFFRLHVGGDFISEEYARMWARIAEKFKGTKFLSFTKRWDIVGNLKFPRNFNIIYSAWPGVDAPPGGRPIAWMDDGTKESAK